jgi:hypothetical protein
VTENYTIAKFKASQKKGPKYGNKPVVLNGIKFPSQRESYRWQKLKIVEKAGAISDLRRQVTYKLRVNGVHITNYRADFVYVRNGETVVEDSKGFLTKEYLIKRALMKAIYGITILET